MLSIQDLRKSFGDITALDRCSFDVARGRMIGFLGPDGAGKTTAMRAVFGLVPPDSGSITWDGNAITHDDRLRFGYMPEQRGLYPKMRARDHVANLGRLHGMAAGEALAAADQWLDRFPLTDRGTDPVESLSHGNQQRVQLATAMVHDPELLMPSVLAYRAAPAAAGLTRQAGLLSSPQVTFGPREHVHKVRCYGGKHFSRTKRRKRK